MWKKFKGLAENVFANIIATIILGAITGLGATGLLIWSSIKGIILNLEGEDISTKYWIMYICGIVLSMACVVLLIINLIKMCKMPRFPKIQSDVRYESAISQLYFKNREEIFCTREVDFELICEKKESITKQFNWTGTEYKCTLLESSDQDYELEDYGRKQSPHGYKIKFNKTKHRGDKVKYKTTTEVSDSNHEMQPFFSHQIKSPTDHLEIRVTAPKKMLKNVTYTIYADDMGEVSISEPVSLRGKTIGNLETFSCKIEKPNLLYNYRIEWDFGS